MSDKKHINLLVLPELFPEFDGDWKGVFIEDYLKSVQSLNPQTLYVRLSGKQKGVTDEKYQDQFYLKRVNITDKKVMNLIKPLMYIKWFIKGVKIGASYSETTVIHAHGGVLNGTLAYLIGKKLNVPFIVTEHVGPYSSVLNSRIKSKISKFVFNKAAKVLAVSQHQKNEILKLGISDDKVKVSFNPVNTDIFNFKKTTTSKNILFVSRLDEFKGGLRTVKAFHKISNKYTDYNLIIGGDGEEFEAIRAYVEENNLTSRIILKGTLTKLQITGLLKESSFFVFPSRHETFGLVVAEALCCGLPVVCTNLTAPKEFINEENGILIDPDSINEISGAMEDLILNRDKYNSEKIHNEIKGRFGLKSFGDYLLTVYREVL